MPSVATLLTPYKGDLYNIDTNPWQRMMTFEADYLLSLMINHFETEWEIKIEPSLWHQNKK